MKAAGEVRLFIALVVLAGLWIILQLYNTPIQESTTERTPALLKQKSVVDARLRDKPLVFYNRVPKCGSNSMLILLRKLAKKNHFAFHEDRVYVIETFEADELQIYTELVNRLPTPSIYEKQIFYIDFRRYGFQQPLYINLVREPLERRVSWYYYIRFGRVSHRALPRNFSRQEMAQTFDECVINNAWECDAQGQESFLMTKYFCGHDPICRKPSQLAVEKAKENIRRHYAVVGVLEEFSSFLKVLEGVMPQFFHGAHDTWNKITQDTELLEQQRTVNRSPPSLRTRKIMRDRLKLDYQVYDFIKERFHMQKKQLGIED